MRKLVPGCLPHLSFLNAAGVSVIGIAFSVLAASSVSAASASKSHRQAMDLLAQMTLDEKIGQMTQVDMNAMKNKADLQKYFIGSMLSGGDSDPADITAAGWREACD